MFGLDFSVILLYSLCVAVLLPYGFVQAQSAKVCNNPVKTCVKSKNYFPDRISLKFIKDQVSEVKYSNTFVDITIKAVSGGQWKYRFVKCGCEAGKVQKGRQVIFTAPKAVFSGSGPILGLLEGADPSLRELKYVFSASNIYSPTVRSRVRKGQTTDLATPGFTIDFDQIKGDDTFGASIIGTFDAKAFQEAKTGKPYLVIPEVSEPSPVARAEWAKVIALLLDRTKEVNRKFGEIASSYARTKREAAAAIRRPSVFFNSPFRDTWFQPSEKQFTTSFARDSNVDYRFGNDGKSTTNSFKFSEILKLFRSATFLVNVGFFPSSSSTTLKKFVEASITTPPGTLTYKNLVRQLVSVRCGNVWSNQRRVTSDGFATDFFESAVFRPDLKLLDYVKLLHPDLSFRGKVTYSYSLGKATPAVVGSKCPFVTLTGKPKKGKAFVDRYFVVSKSNRFSIEDRLEDQVLPKLSQLLKTKRESIDVFFTNAHTKKDVSLTVRILASKKDVKELASTKDVLNGLKTSIKGSVKEINVKQYRSRLAARRRVQSRC